MLTSDCIKISCWATELTDGLLGMGGGGLNEAVVGWMGRVSVFLSTCCSDVYFKIRFS